MKNPGILAGGIVGLLLAGPAMAQSVAPGYSAPWLAQIGVTSAIQTTANGGAGFNIGIVDTGVVTNHPELAGRVSTSSSCAAVTFLCSRGVTDDNGHGTSVASIAAGSTATGGLMSGVAPKATIIAEKVLNANGSGYDADVANGIVKATNAGAQVINLSLTYIPTASVINAINYAASKGAIIVFAGGNSAVALNGGANSNGFTAAALSRLVFVGSVNSANRTSSFSNTPGNGSAVAGATRSSYASLWLMAPGESIVAPGIMYGANAYAYWTGTSMAAPMVSGALALLETTWPVLNRNGTATSVLFQTATDLGATGIDTATGNGLLNMSKAFQPIGALTVTQTNGKSVTVASLTNSLLTGGALGSMSSVTSQLAKYTAFDSFQRNYVVNLSGLVQKNATGVSAAAAAQAPTVTSTAVRLADGMTLAFARADAPSTINDKASLIGSASSQPSRLASSWVMKLTGATGTSIAAGTGFPASASFAETLWGEGSIAGSQARDLDVSNGLLQLAHGGTFASIGSKLGTDTRIAFSFSNTAAFSEGVAGNKSLADTLMGRDWTRAQAAGVAMGVTTTLRKGWTGGMTLSVLNEKNGLLGTIYDRAGSLALGNQHKSVSVGISSSVDLWQGAGLMFDAALSASDGASASSGLITGVSATTARSFGLSLVQRDALTEGDSLSVTLKKPLRVTSGSANLTTTSVDDQGFATTAATRVSLKPSGSQTDLVLGYSRSLRPGVDVSASLTVSSDAGNVRGTNAVGGLAKMSLRF